MTNLDNSNNPMKTLGMFSTKKTRTMVPTILARCRSRLLEREPLGLKKWANYFYFNCNISNLRKSMKLRDASKKSGARPVVVRGWRDW